MSTKFMPQRIACLFGLFIFGILLTHWGGSESVEASTTRFDYHERICNHCFVDNRKHYEACWKGGCKKCDSECCPGDPGHDCCCIHNVDECKCEKPKPKPEPNPTSESPKKSSRSI